MITPAEMAREMETVNRALSETRVLLAGMDQVNSARDLRPLAHSPLRTLVEHAEQSAGLVTKYLRDQPRT
ncbi:hypothetical protein [Micromonospora eburnea]|uniref:Uncharacterized protein n=1 Tax=Micromonospora eburnea TaxID=227316 RepID=A0A1C6UX34_9ACTN|nr:hypothetical protein [Micromonospora eburnea]SCL58634.1 hypothetical protein GA0070604_3879 [Micromonospora eburnea]